MQDGDVVDQIKLAELPMGDVIYEGQGLFTSDAAKIIAGAAILQGALESSNVNNADEMIIMVELMRHFESSSKVLSAYDTMLGDAIDTLGNF